MKFTKSTIPLLILLLFHLIGLIGILGVDRQLFASLSPYNLLLSLLLIFISERGDRTKMISLMLVIMLSGFGVEWLGVHSNFPFGSYQYGKALGYKLDGVPIIIGVNWFLMVVSTAAVANRIGGNRFLRSLLAATLMVIVDIPIEAVCEKLDYWHWQAGSAPLSNFAAWLGVGFIMQYFAQPWLKSLNNQLAFYYMIIVLLFFIILNLAL